VVDEQVLPENGDDVSRSGDDVGDRELRMKRGRQRQQRGAAKRAEKMSSPHAHPFDRSHG
jgi:hypothetical protein